MSVSPFQVKLQMMRHPCLLASLSGQFVTRALVSVWAVFALFVALALVSRAFVCR